MKEEITVLMSRAYNCLAEAELLYREDRYNGVTNRAYYAVFDAANAILRLKDLYATTHSGLNHTFNFYFVRTEQLPSRMNRLLTRSFDLRQTGDYDFSRDITREEAIESIEYAKEFLLYTEAYLREQDLADPDNT